MFHFVLGDASAEAIAIDLPQRAQGREGWLDTDVVVTVSGFVGRVSTCFEVDDFAKFHTGLVSLYDTLTGIAELAHRERQLSLIVSGNGRGVVDVKGRVHAHPTHGSKLDFEFKIDQTYLAEPIRVLGGFIESHRERVAPVA